VHLRGPNAHRQAGLLPPMVPRRTHARTVQTRSRGLCGSRPVGSSRWPGHWFGRNLEFYLWGAGELGPDADEGDRPLSGSLNRDRRAHVRARTLVTRVGGARTDCLFRWDISIPPNNLYGDPRQ